MLDLINKQLNKPINLLTYSYFYIYIFYVTKHVRKTFSRELSHLGFKPFGKFDPPAFLK